MFFTIGSGGAGFIYGRKIVEVKRRLVETTWRFNRIARFCGFTSEDVLARSFLRETGMTLSDFRQTGNLH